MTVRHYGWVAGDLALSSEASHGPVDWSYFLLWYHILHAEEAWTSLS